MTRYADELSLRVKQRHRRRSVSMSDEMWEAMQHQCANIMSVSSFVERAVKKELESAFFGQK